MCLVGNGCGSLSCTEKPGEQGGRCHSNSHSHDFINVHPLDISTGPLARSTFQGAGPVRASTFYLSLARTGHLSICRATRFQIVLARTMTNHSMYFSRGRPSHISAVFAQSFCYANVSRVGVGHVNQTH